jgi:phosphate transport system protein
VTLHLQKDLESLKRRILEMGQIVAERARDAVHALLHQDASAARRVIDGDDDIDQREVAIEEEALKILALHQPVATDLRWVIAVLKVNSDLEPLARPSASVSTSIAWERWRSEC